MKNSVTLLCVILLNSFSVSAQSTPQIIEEKSLFENMEGWQSAKQIIETENGDFVLAGHSSQYGDEILVCRVSPEFDVIWKISVDGDYRDKANAVTQARDGGFIVAATTTSTSINGVERKNRQEYTDIFVFKLDAHGKIVWQKMILGEGKAQAYPRDIIATPDGGCIVLGYIWADESYELETLGGGDCYLFRLNADGDVIWQKVFGGPKSDHGYCLAQSPDGHYLLAGDTESSFSLDHGRAFYKDVYVVKFNGRGEPLWQRNYGGLGGELALDIDVTAQGDILIFGGSDSKDIEGCTNSGEGDFYIIKLDFNGDILWQKMYGMPFDDIALSGCAASDGGFAAAGVVHPGDDSWGDTASYFIKLDSQGGLVWELQRGGGFYDQADSVIETRDGHLAAVYNMYNDIYVIKIKNDR